MRQPDGRQLSIHRQLLNRLTQRNVDSDQDDSEVLVHQHHCKIFCSAKVSQDFCMSGIVDICQSQRCFIDGSRYHSSDSILQGKIDCGSNIVVCCFTCPCVQLPEGKIFRKVAE